ncbi:FAD-dependent oxidoreductase [Membranicola marinus]|uniref:FAD-dependent oxidoreductase n=1 Tax=Membranihabitans marinus TaxID=1227546 RepID=A0A953HKH9_9BACT|nr:FAD-dependent oxidoreductase [Membranihabitans marinus]MBY5957352.1 FAD-dependent oxidoreductase [Membranihabitans marinus]
MKRRDFAKLITAGGGLTLVPSCVATGKAGKMKPGSKDPRELSADVAIIGGGLGGCAAALAACRNGLRVILTEETDWIGGQIAQQGVPPDEHGSIETHGAPQSYRDYRDKVRNYYKQNYPMTEEARNRKYLNPGDGSVSRICHEPRVSVAVLREMLNPYISAGKLELLIRHKASGADVQGDEVRAIEVTDQDTGSAVVVHAPYFVDATELGDLLPMTNTEYVSGTESKKETGELHAPEVADPRNHQAFTFCFAMDYQPGKDNVIDKPKDYDYWNSYVPDMDPPWAGKLLELNYSNPRNLKPKDLGFHPEGKKTGNKLNLWLYRRMINRHNFLPGTYDGDITIVNWPQNDYFKGNLIDVSEKEFNETIEGARQLNLSLFYWLQTEAPRPDGGKGWPGLRLRGDVMGTADGMAKYPYVREARRIKAEFTVLEEHVGAEQRKMVAGPEKGKTAPDFYDSVGTGYYHIDLHPSNRGDNYIDFGSLPFQIPLGSLLPIRVNNLLPANKNIGTTHITNGCYRLHPVEWSIGEAVGCLTAYAMKHNIPPRAVRSDKRRLADFQDWIRSQGLETHWPKK